MKGRTKHLTEIELGMSNFDHSIDEGLGEKLLSGPYYATYAAWNFHAQVWWDDCFHAEVWRYGDIVETVHCKSLEEIMDTLSAKYGYE